MSRKNYFYLFVLRINPMVSLLLVRSPKDGELLGLERGKINQVSYIIYPDQYSKESDTI